MSSISFELEASIRNDMGKGASRRLRRTNQVPAIIYGAGKPPVSLTLDHLKVLHAVAHEGFYSHILTIKTDGQSEKVILKAMQRHPARKQVLHMDFLRVRADQKLHMHIPLHFIGSDVAPGLKEGGVFAHNMNDVEISCLPANLPEYIEVDVSNMNLDDSIHLSQLKLPKGVELVAFAHGVEGHDLSVVSLHVPRIIEEEVIAPAEGEAVEGAEAAAPAEGEAPAATGEQPAATVEKKDKKEKE